MTPTTLLRGAAALALAIGLTGSAAALPQPQIALTENGRFVRSLMAEDSLLELTHLSTRDGTSPVPPLRLQVSGLQAATIRGDSIVAAVATGDGRLRLTNLDTGRETEFLQRVPGVKRLRLSQHGEVLAVATARQIVVLNTQTRLPVAEISLGSQRYSAMAVRTDLLMVGTAAGHVQMFRTETGEELRCLEPVSVSPVVALDFEQSEFAAVAWKDGNIAVWNPARGIRLSTWKLRAGGRPTAVAFWPAARWLAVASRSGPVELFEATSGMRLGSFPAETAGAVALDGSVGATIAALYPDGRILILDARSRTIKARYKG